MSTVARTPPSGQPPDGDSRLAWAKVLVPLVTALVWLFVEMLKHIE